MRVGSVTLKPNFGEITLDRRINISQKNIVSSDTKVDKDDDISLSIDEKTVNEVINNVVTKPITGKNICKRPFLSVTARKRI